MYDDRPAFSRVEWWHMDNVYLRHLGDWSLGMISPSRKLGMIIIPSIDYHSSNTQYKSSELWKSTL
jgi:hypothetical protein